MFGSRLFNSRRRPKRNLSARLFLEPLEAREVPAAVTVNAGQVVRTVNAHVLAANVAWWDSSLNTAQTQQMIQAAGLTMYRLPGGSSSDDWHFNAAPTYSGEGTAPSMATFIASVNGGGLVTLDYGSGSPQEAAAFLAYLNAPTTNTTAIGIGPEWSDSGNAWVNVDWKSADYWAGFRAAAPLTHDDGLNFLRISRSAPFSFHYYEVGNEEYGTWEVDHHGTGSVGGQPHDPATYITFAKQFASYAAQIDPTISIGVDSGAVSTYYNKWISNVLQQGKSQGFIPGFISDHSYMQAPGSESDSNLLLDTVSDPNNQDPNNPYDWPLRAAGYRNVITQTLGSAGAGVELLATEYNSVYSNPGKQTTSLVNGLFVADSIGSTLQTEYNASLIWDIRNGWDTSNNNSATLYGWRLGGDYGILGSSGTPPSTGTYVPYPNYFAEQLASQMVHTGDTVLEATSSDPNLAVYAVKQAATGHVDLLIINKNATTDLSGQFQFSGFAPDSQAQFWQYGKTQDTAQSQTTDGHSALYNFSATLNLSAGNFNYTFPSYSMTVVDLAPDQAPTVAVAAAASPNPVTGKTTALSVLGADDDGESSLTYTWATTGIPPAPVSFSINGTNAAKNTTATFAKAGAYSFLVTITDSSGLSVTSNVNVTVDQTMTTIKVSPSTVTIKVNGTQQFAALAKDQFGKPMASQPTFTWQVVQGGGTITSIGLYTAPSTTGTARVRASSGNVRGSAKITIVTGAAAELARVFLVTSTTGNGTEPAGQPNRRIDIDLQVHCVSNAPLNVGAAVRTYWADGRSYLRLQAGHSGSNSPLPDMFQIMSSDNG
jgi:hypothetical protein